ncbi:MAG: hypothetical protein IT373_02920, partial [Polyangiaceae bacterium]|nr:hypothetical protein [Polyangiaceae bacterium]
GSCGQAVVELDARKFFDEKRGLDCAACSRCGYDGARCLAACAKDAPEQSFPAGCFPLVHDGEVCLNALRAAGCSEYAAYVDDLAPTVPGECNFCPRDETAALGPGADVVEEAP